jgi:hypothetical protein
MTRPPQRKPAPPRDRPQGAPGQAPEPPAGHCMRCGAVGTHYLTCPGLRLPPGYRLSAEPGPGQLEPAWGTLTAVPRVRPARPEARAARNTPAT